MPRVWMPEVGLVCPKCGHLLIYKPTSNNMVYVRCPRCGWYRVIRGGR